MRRLLSDQQGITLMEIIIAVAIMAVGLVALSASIPLAAYGIHEGSQLSTATFLANQRLEQVRNAQWALCTDATHPDTDKVGVSASSTAAPQIGGVTTFPDETTSQITGYAGFSRQVRIDNVVAPDDCATAVAAAAPLPPSPKGLRQVTVTVRYRPMTGTGLSAAGTTKPVTVTMYIAQR